jgi:hypothetical protein
MFGVLKWSGRFWMKHYVVHLWCRHLATAAGEDLTSFDIGWKIFAHPVNQSESTIGTFMALFLFVACMFSFVITVRSALLTAPLFLL